jgi:hypothetical protein
MDTLARSLNRDSPVISKEEGSYDLDRQAVRDLAINVPGCLGVSRNLNPKNL